MAKIERQKIKAQVITPVNTTNFREYDDLTADEQKLVKDYIAFVLHKEKDYPYTKFIDVTPTDLYRDYVYLIKNKSLVDLEKKQK